MRMPPKRKAIKKDEVVEAGLRAIYGEQRASAFPPKPRASSRWLLRIILASAALAILASTWLLIAARGWGSGNGVPLELLIETPATEVRGGEEIAFDVVYRNLGRVPLANLTIDLHLPDALVATSFSPAATDPEQLRWQLGALGRASDGRITVRGIWHGGPGDVRDIQAVATYRPGNVSAEFSGIASTTLTTSTGALTMTVDSPARAIPGEQVVYTIHITNAAQIPLSCAAVTAALPEGLTLTATTPAVAPGGSPQWALPDLPVGGTTDIRLEGAYVAEASGVLTGSATATWCLPGGGTIAQATESLSTEVQGGALRLALVGNGTSGNVSVAPGGTLRLLVRVSNAGEQPISDARVLLDFAPASGIPLSWRTAMLDGGTITRDGIVLSSTLIGTLAPGQEKTFHLAFPVASPLPNDALDGFSVTARATGAGATLASAPLAITVNATLAIAAAAAYTAQDGTPIGEGPYPPEVGRATTMVVTWSLQSALHDVEDAVMTAALPPGVTFGAPLTVATGAVTYDEPSRTVRWRVDELQADDGVATATFTIIAIPGAEDEATMMSLMTAPRAQATDRTTGNRVESSTEALTMIVATLP